MTKLLDSLIEGVVDMFRVCITALVSCFAFFSWNDVSADIIADAVGDYEAGIQPGDTVNPAATGTGNWRYLRSNTLNPYDAGNTILEDLVWDTGSAGMFERSVHSNHTNGFDTERFDGLAGFLRFSPPPSQGNSGVPDVLVARWISGVGEAGLVDITGDVRGMANNSLGAGAKMIIFVDGVSVFDVLVTREGGSSVTNFDLSAISINTGSTVDFVVDDFGANTFDFIGLRTTIRSSSIPEPGGIGFLALTVFGVSCFASRRRRYPRQSERPHSQ